MNYRLLPPNLHSDTALQASGEGQLYDYSIVDLSTTTQINAYILQKVIATIPHWIYMAAGCCVGLMQ
jgi:hypothetical protein